MSPTEEGTCYQEELEKHHLEITKNLDLDRQYILSHLRSKSILDDEDCQLIKAGVSRQQKASKFIDVLMTKGPSGFTHFIEALEIEHPHLYEVITGNKPVGQRENPCEPITSWAVTTDKAVMDFDREFLVQELKKHADTNRKMTYFQEKLIREKMTMEKKLEEITRERDNLFEDLQLALEEKNGESSELDDKNNTHQEDIRNYIQQIQELLQVNFEKSSIIIRLQSRLLEINEMFDVCKKNNGELRHKNENLMQQVRDLTINYDFQRTQSKRLSEQVNQNKCELNRVATTKREIHALKFELARVKEEKEELLHELEEFKEVAAAMNVKCDMLLEEKTSEEEKRGEVSIDFKNVQSKVKHLEIILHDERNKTDMFQRKSERMTQEVETHKDQRDFYVTEREHAICERNQMIRERDDALRMNSELQKSRDETIQKQIATATHYEKRNSAITEDLERTSEELKQWRMKALYLLKEKEETETLKTADDANGSECTTTKDVVYEELNKKLNKWNQRRNSDILKSSYNKLGFSQLNRCLYPTIFQGDIKSPEEEVIASLTYLHSPTKPPKTLTRQSGIFYGDNVSLAFNPCIGNMEEISTPTTSSVSVAGLKHKSSKSEIHISTKSTTRNEIENQDPTTTSKPININENNRSKSTKNCITQSSSSPPSNSSSFHPRLTRQVANDPKNRWLALPATSICGNKDEVPMQRFRANAYDKTSCSDSRPIVRQKACTLHGGISEKNKEEMLKIKIRRRSEPVMRAAEHFH